MAAEPLFQLSVEQYHEMARAGILTEDDPVELLEGMLVLKMTKNPPHCMATDNTRDALADLVRPAWHVRAQDPVTTESSEPEPDLFVVRGKRSDYGDRHPGARDLGLLVEVSDSSLPRDRGWKKRIYARALVPVYWIVNLVDRQLEVYTNPSGPTEEPDYRQCTIYGPDDEVPVVLDGVEVGRLKVRDLLP